MKPLKTILLSLFSTIFSLFFFAIVLAGGCQDGLSCSGTSNCGCTRYRVDPGETITVFEHNLCQRVTNNSGYPQTFIPAKTQTEWNLFCTFRPNHISCSACTNLISACPPGTQGEQNHLLGRYYLSSFWQCYGSYCSLPICTPEWRYKIDLSLSDSNQTASCIIAPGSNMPHMWGSIRGGNSQAYCVNSYNSLAGVDCQYCVIGGESTLTLLPTCPFGHEQIGTVFARHIDCDWWKAMGRVFGPSTSGGCQYIPGGTNTGYLSRSYSIRTGNGRAQCYVSYSGGGNNTYCQLCIVRDPPNIKRVFVTSQKFKGTDIFSNIDFANQKCQELGSIIDPNTTWRAWISTGGINARDNIQCGKKRYVNVRNEVIANYCGELLNRATDYQEHYWYYNNSYLLQKPIYYDENGVAYNNSNKIDPSIPHSIFVWSNTKEDGTALSNNPLAQNCKIAGILGDPGRVFGSWTADIIQSVSWGGPTYYRIPNSCEDRHPIYCFEL
jgi:hypothetical protein